MAVKYLVVVCLVSALYSQANGKAQRRNHQQSRAGSAFLDYGNVRCNYNYPIYCETATDYCCPTSAPICCGDQTCCPNDHPFCSDGLCYASGSMRCCCLFYMIITMVFMFLMIL